MSLSVQNNSLFTNEQIRFMQRALECAKLAVSTSDVPVGAVIVKDGKIISEGYNKREADQNALLHAEIVAIDGACKALGTWRLEDCDMYVTLEPCPMCAGAIINSRIHRVYFGAYDVKNGAFGGVCDLSREFTFKPEIHQGLLENECADVLSDFFEKLR